jgi:hypothetical protein
MSHPQGDRIFDCDPAELWAQREEVGDNDRDEYREFRELLLRIPQFTRDKLTAMWKFEYESRDDGGVGTFVTDDLFDVFLHDTLGIAPLESGETSDHSISYLQALCDVLGIPILSIDAEND